MSTNDRPTFSPGGYTASRNISPHGNAHSAAATDLPYFPPPPTSPFLEPRADPLDRAEEGALPELP